MAAILAFAYLASSYTALSQEDASFESEGSDLFQPLPSSTGKDGPEMFFDADTTQFTRDGNRQVFKGNVVAVGGGALVTADLVTLDRTKNILEADGHVIILTENQVYTGDRLIYGLSTGDILLVNSLMIANDPKESQRISEKVLGFTPAELAFEKKRQLQLETIDRSKSNLKSEFRDNVQVTPIPTEEMLDQYSLLLEKEDLISRQENPLLAQMSEDLRRRFKARRYHWKKGLEDAQKIKKGARLTSFFQIRGKVLEKKDQNNYFAEEAFWSPCNCEEDELPAWGFRADRLSGQMEGYLDFYHPVLEIKGVPILYLPYMKFPLKEKRQSGFLMPTFGLSPGSGNTYTQPIFFDLGENLDTTITPEIFELRGTKLGVELRYQQKEYSGWELNVEGIRDRLWMQDRKKREDIIENLSADEDREFNDICIDDNPNEELICRRAINRQLAVPDNTWRHAQKWRGLSVLAPRLSFVSVGNINSDHRYTEELTILDDKDAQSVFEDATQATFFSTVKYRTNLDAKNFYLGVGGAYGDNVRSTERFKGQQIPFNFSLQSRFFSLDRHQFSIPIYVQGSAQHIRISDWVGNSDGLPQEEGENKTLGEGDWQKVEFNQVSPLISEGIFRLDHFTDYEVRSITHSGLDEPRSSIRSWRTGVTLNLPIDGDLKLPRIFQGQAETRFGEKYVRHYMNWALTFSVRPSVNHDGEYGSNQFQVFDSGKNQFGPGGDLVYFESDLRSDERASGEIEADEMMIKHRKISFSTNHSWDLFDRGWQRLQGSSSVAGGAEKERPGYSERAKIELLNSLDRPIGDYSEMFGESGEDWFINRYKLIEQNSQRIIYFSSDIDYDFVKEEARKKIIKELDNPATEEQKARKARGQSGLPQPWGKPRFKLGFNVIETNLENETRYNLYTKIIEEQVFRLNLPRFFSTSVGFEYYIKNESIPDKNIQEDRTERTIERLARVVSQIVPHFDLGANYGVKTIDDPKQASLPPQYKTEFGAVYSSPSQCWRLRFSRQKDYGEREEMASYRMQLSVLFLGGERGHQGNLATSLERDLQKE